MGVIGIEKILTALVNIDHLLGAFSWDPILTQAAKKFDVAFHDIKLFNMSLNGITLVLVPQYIAKFKFRM